MGTVFSDEPNPYSVHVESPSTWSRWLRAAPSTMARNWRLPSAVASNDDADPSLLDLGQNSIKYLASTSSSTVLGPQIFSHIA